VRVLSTQSSAEDSGWIKLRLSRMLARVKLRIVGGGGGGGGSGVLRETRETREARGTGTLLWWCWWER
jgi:hypothetical protein